MNIFIKSTKPGKNQLCAYDKGIDVPQDIDKAIDLWQQAAAQGVWRAKVALEIMKEQ